jgi:hypothetical protein
MSVPSIEMPTFCSSTPKNRLPPSRSIVRWPFRYFADSSMM